MGSGNYFADVRTAQRAVESAPRSSDTAFDYDRSARSGRVQGVHPDLNIFDRIRESCDSAEHLLSTPIVVAMDVTKSRGDDAKAVYSEVPKLLGVLKTHGYVPDPQIMWAAIGDANCDKAPIQVSQFESDRRIDGELAKIWMEEGGGGTGEESYELLAYYLAHNTKLDCVKRGERGFLFFTGDEAPYPELSAAQIRTHIGGSIKKAVSTEAIFRELAKKYNSFLVFPRSKMEDRVKFIDAEIRKRLEEAGGRFKEVSIRCSLIWENRNDLDLHCLTPNGDHIFYGNKRVSCGGELDVDRNVNGETTKPVENIRWAKGTARPGKYRFWVENYRYHERSQIDVPFRVELDVDGDIKTFEGIIPAGAMHKDGAQTAFEFTYSPAEAKAAAKDAHAAYTDEVVLEKWTRYLPDTQILRIQDPKSAVEVMLGVLALTKGGMDLGQFDESMKERKVAKERRTDVIAALHEFAVRGVRKEVGTDCFA